MCKGLRGSVGIRGHPKEVGGPVVPKHLLLKVINFFYFHREKLLHTDVSFNPNGTMTYTAHRTAIFLPELNHLSLNASVVLPNLAVLVSLFYFWFKQ